MYICDSLNQEGLPAYTKTAVFLVFVLESRKLQRSMYTGKRRAYSTENNQDLHLKYEYAVKDL